MISAGFSILFCAVLMASPEVAADDSLHVSIRTLDEDNIQATLKQLSPEMLDVVVDGTTRLIPTEDVIRIAPKRSAASVDQVSGPALVTCYPVEGGLLEGTILADAPTGMLRLSVGIDAPIDVPLTAVAAIRFGRLEDSAMVAEFEKRRMERKPGRDVLLITRDGRPTVVPGALESLSTDGWSFRFGSKLRSGHFSTAFGVVLGSAAARGAHGNVGISFGASNEVFGRLVEGDASSVLLDAGPMGRVAIPWTMIRRLDFDSGRVVRLSNLTPLSSTCETIIGGDWPARRNLSVIGDRLRIGSRSYADGWGVHANSRLEFALDGEFERFVAEVGVDASVGLRGSVIFRVIADGEVLASSDVIRGGQAAAKLKVDLGNAKRLVLECDRADGLDLSDHGNWVNAYLVRRKDRDPS